MRRGIQSSRELIKLEHKGGVRALHVTWFVEGKDWAKRMGGAGREWERPVASMKAGKVWFWVVK